MASIVPLFPNWIVRHMRSPNLHTAAWLKRPVEVFFISPKMTKLELREYLRVLYDIPVSKVRARAQGTGSLAAAHTSTRAQVHTANYRGKTRPRKHKNDKCARALPCWRGAASEMMRGACRWKEPDYKKAYVYLKDEHGAQRPRYHQIEAQLTDLYRRAWPARPGQQADFSVLRRGRNGEQDSAAARPDSSREAPGVD